MPDAPDGPRRFQANVRHYHRSSNVPVSRPVEIDRDGRPVPRKLPLWLRIVGITAGTLVLGGIISGLIIELSA
jgi:hypothetical protein